MLALLAAVLVCLAIHLCAIAAAAGLCGVPIREISFGVGPTVYRRGMLRIGLIPCGGYVRLLDTTQEFVPEHEWPRALDQQPLAKRLFISLAGCLSLALLSLAIAGAAAWEAMTAAPAQFFTGAFSPLRQAQSLLAAAHAFVASAGFLPVLAVVAAKFAAFNALPLPALNGGDVVAAIARRAGLGRWWPPQVTVALLLAMLGAGLSWLVALAAYVSGR